MSSSKHALDALVNEGRFRRLQLALQGAALFAIAAIITHGVVVGVEYRRAEVLDVVTVPGKGDRHRLVVVDLGDYQRALRTSDWMIPTQVGGQVCVARRNVIGRRWVIHRLSLPGYCRNLLNGFASDALSEMPYGCAGGNAQDILDIAGDRSETDDGRTAFMQPEGGRDLCQTGAADFALGQ